MRGKSARGLVCTAVALGLAVGFAASAGAADEPSLKGTFTFNGEAKSLPFVYVIPEAKGFYDDADPTYKVLFVAREVPERELDEHIWDAAYLELGITRTAEFDDAPKWQVYSQNIVADPDAGGNVSGGTYPELELTSTGPDTFAGRVYTKAPLDFFGDTIAYDFTFSAPVSDPDAPIGDPLPAGGGEPGKAYLAWVAALHAGDLAKLKTMVPAEMAAQFDEEDAAEGLEFMQMMTPTDIKILGGSSDGATAILKVEGMMDGEKVAGEVTLVKMDGHWMAKKSSW